MVVGENQKVILPWFWQDSGRVAPGNIDFSTFSARERGVLTKGFSSICSLCMATGAVAFPLWLCVSNKTALDLHSHGQHDQRKPAFLCPHLVRPTSVYWVPLMFKNEGLWTQQYKQRICLLTIKYSEKNIFIPNKNTHIHVYIHTHVYWNGVSWNNAKSYHEMYSDIFCIQIFSTTLHPIFFCFKNILVSLIKTDLWTTNRFWNTVCKTLLW